jgi:putative lipoic acid-binding regulatory protein
MMTGGKTMNKNGHSFSNDDLMRLINSEAGQQLISMIRSKNDPKIQQAAKEAAKGNYESAAQALSSALDTQQLQSILEQLRGQIHG